MIREEKTHHIRSMFQHAENEFHAIEISLSKLVQKGDITLEEGIKYCESPAELREMVSRRP
jgi:Tfp pilus assembly pilus retraction ATPase PilT